MCVPKAGFFGLGYLIISKLSFLAMLPVILIFGRVSVEGKGLRENVCSILGFYQSLNNKYFAGMFNVKLVRQIKYDPSPTSPLIKGRGFQGLFFCQMNVKIK
jgi:hypothetical protein